MANPQQSEQSGDDWNDWQGSLGAAARGGVDALTLGLGGKVGAATDATMALARGQDWYNRYKADLNQQQAQAHYDETHHRLARIAGQAIGTVVGLAATDGLTAAPGAGARLASLADYSYPTLARTLRPFGAAAGVGAGAGVAGRALSDTVTNHLSSPQAYLADAAGGAVGGAATLARSAAAGAAADAVTGGLLNSALTHQPVNLEDIEKNALGGSYLGVIGHQIGTALTDSLQGRSQKGKFTKGDLGELTSRIRSRIMGADVVDTQKNRKVSGGQTRVDSIIQYPNGPEIPVEAKMGWDADLKPRQREARAELRDYQIDHFLPEDYGKALGGLLGVFAIHPNRNTDPSWQATRPPSP